MKMFNLIGFGERAGSGVPDIYATWEQAGYAEPKVEEIFGGGQPNRTILIVPLVDKNQAVLEKGHENGTQSGTQNDTQKGSKDQLVELIKGNPSITREELARELGISKRTVSRWINENNNIHYIGSSKNGHWVYEE